MTVEPCVSFGCECWHFTRQDGTYLDGVLSRMVRKIMGHKRRCSPLGVELWLDWWRRTGRLAKKVRMARRGLPSVVCGLRLSKMGGGRPRSVLSPVPTPVTLNGSATGLVRLTWL